MEALDLIFEFEKDCQSFSKNIRKRICKRIIKSLNNNLTGFAGDDYDAIGMSYFDKLSVRYQDSLDEDIVDGLFEMIEAEINCLRSDDAHFLFYSRISEDYDIDHEAIRSDIFNDLCHMIDEHYYTKKVQKFIEKHDWL